MKITIFVLFIVVLASCTKKDPIYYEYNGVTITRIDNGNKIFFYYGRYDEGNVYPDSYIKAEYSGFNSGMEAYIVFKPNKKVEIIREYDSFEKIGKDTNIYLTEYMENTLFIHLVDSITGNFQNIVHVSNILKNEKKINIENNSKVKLIYPMSVQ